MASPGFVFNLDPILIHIGNGGIHYYGVVFAITLLIGFVLWRSQMLRGGYSARVAEDILIWGVLGVVGGARLGHILFYEPWDFLPRNLLADPIKILRVWEGGLASHGAVIGIVTVLILYARRCKRPALEFMDRFSFSAAVGAAGIRFGNFLNSEIVGRPTNLPWAVTFVRYDNVPRHPSQLYEFALGIAVLGVLVLVDRLAGKEKRPLGLLTAVFLMMYFAGRFLVEFVKAPQGIDNNWPIDMGQILSIPAFLAGVALAIWVWRQPRTAPPVQAELQPEKATPESAKSAGKRRKRQV